MQVVCSVSEWHFHLLWAGNLTGLKITCTLWSTMQRRAVNVQLFVLPWCTQANIYIPIQHFYTYLQCVRRVSLYCSLISYWKLDNLFLPSFWRAKEAVEFLCFRAKKQCLLVVFGIYTVLRFSFLGNFRRISRSCTVIINMHFNFF